jgi:class 3 adenylate cyclase/outer membrane protein assembly factor BamB
MSDRRISTVLMLDIVGSTHIAAELGDARYRELSRRFDQLVRSSLKRSGGKEEDHAGDGFFATFAQPDRAIRCAASISDEVRALGIEIRAGIHTGQTQAQAGKAQGIAVVIGARVMSLAGPGEILVTSTAKELVTGSGFRFEDLSAHELKGVPGTWQVFDVRAIDGEERAGPLPAAEAAERLAGIRPGSDRDRPRRVGLGALVSGGVAALSVVAFVLFVDDGTPTPTAPEEPRSGTVVQLDPETGDLLTSIEASSPGRELVEGTPAVSNHAMIVGQGGVWVARSPHFLIHLDPMDRDVRSLVTLPAAGLSFSINLTEGADSIWVAYNRGLAEVHPATDEHRLLVRFPENDPTADVAFGAGTVWMGTGTGQMLRLDPATERERWTEGLAAIDQVAFGHSAVWTVDVLGSEVTRYDPATMEPIARIPVEGGVDALVVGEERLWALSRDLGLIIEIDPATNEAGRSVQVGEAPTAIAAGLGAVWIGDRDGSITGVDEDTRQKREIPFGAEIRAMAFDDDTDTLWVDVA